MKKRGIFPSRLKVHITYLQEIKANPDQYLQEGPHCPPATASESLTHPRSGLFQLGNT